MHARLKKVFEIKGYRIFVLCMLMIGIGISITMPYLPLYFTAELGMSTGAFGVFMAVSSLSGVAVNSLIAKRSDSGLDRKWLLIAAMLSSTLAYVAYLVFDSFLILLIVVSILSGLGAAAIPQIYAYAQESANASQSDDKTFAMSALRSLISLGFLIGPLAGTLLLAAAGYSGLFLVTSAIYLTTASLVFLFLASRKANPRNPRKRTVSSTSSLSSMQIRQPFIAFILLFMVNAMNLVNTPLFIVNELQGTHTDIGLVVGICAGLEIPIMLVLGAFGRRISNHTLLMIGNIIAVFYFVILSVSNDPIQLIIAQLLQATFVAIVMGNGLSYFTNILADSPGVAITLYTNASTIGRLAGTLGSGIIAQFTGFRSVYWMCLVIVILSLVLLWRTRSQVGKEVLLPM
ncbi:sugar efflux transporter [Paenibacillus sp. PL91]|uniref:sugar efflux transporter n=1 Tax=Paenibacillus sp. PL91 TaxID=2729538 RepID=UPI00145E9D19|nr:sugar efflux transporter [Paenibacillus sp. PL91]MBC9203971.1 sugar efflux transporter [Paenibacillus sp. PL91]